MVFGEKALELKLADLQAKLNAEKRPAKIHELDVFKAIPLSFLMSVCCSFVRCVVMCFKLLAVLAARCWIDVWLMYGSACCMCFMLLLETCTGTWYIAASMQYIALSVGMDCEVLGRCFSIS
jgi:hypothetical protein